MNLRVRRVTGVSAMIAVSGIDEEVESPAARICEREKEQKLDRDERVGGIVEVAAVVAGFLEMRFNFASVSLCSSSCGLG